MRAMSNEPSMEEILSSIKRIIAEEDIPAQGARAPGRASATAPRFATREAEAEADEFSDDDQILELTDALTGDAADTAAPQEAVAMAIPAKSGTPAPETRGSSAATKAEPSRPARAARGRAATAAGTGAGAPPTASPAPATSPDPAQASAAPAVMSDISAEAARESLVNLSRLLVRSDDGQSNTLEGLVREMLRPVLKEWLDANLPELVETMVKREIDRITGRV